MAATTPAQSSASRRVSQGAFQHHATYATGVALAALGKLDDAAQVFDSLLKFVPSTDAQKEIRLTHLARGRVYYETGDIESSIDAYQSIDHRSKYFDEMLFEITWAYVQSAEGKEDAEEKDLQYKEAVRAVEILLASNPTPRLCPRLRCCSVTCTCVSSSTGWRSKRLIRWSRTTSLGTSSFAALFVSAVTPCVTFGRSSQPV